MRCSSTSKAHARVLQSLIVRCGVPSQGLARAHRRLACHIVMVEGTPGCHLSCDVQILICGRDGKNITGTTTHNAKKVHE